MLHLLDVAINLMLMDVARVYMLWTGHTTLSFRACLTACRTAHGIAQVLDDDGTFQQGYQVGDFITKFSKLAKSGLPLAKFIFDS